MADLKLAAGILVAIAASAFATPRQGATVAIKTFKFRPDTVVVGVGASVRWTNEDEIEHTVTPDSSAESRAKFGGVLRAKGATSTSSFGRPGTYPYYCERHQFMRGVVRVTTPGDKQ